MTEKTLNDFLSDYKNYTYEENPEKGTFYCDSPIFNGSFSILNGFLWFVSRGLNTFPPVVLSIFMFKKKK